MWAGEEFCQMKLRLQHDGRTFDLNGLKQLGSGGEAIVYSLNGTPWAAKVYSKLVSGRDEKLRVMLANPPKDPTSAQGHVSIAWPQDLLIDQHGRIVGYVMPQVEQMRRMFDFYNPGTRRKKCPLFTYKYLVATALNLSIAVRALHQRGYVMGDVNESNFLVAENTMVTLVDTDSFQVREPGNGKIHHCTVASPLFTPREMQGVDFTMAVRREEQDLFGFGVLLFQLLMEGSHPFQARFTGAGDSPEPIEMIRLGNFPHGTGSAMWEPPPVAPAFGMLDPKLRSLFTRCFVNGHRDPKARPTADEWCANLKEALGILIDCKVNPSHLHWPHITRCPWCERKEKLGGRDPFPPPDQVRSGAHIASAASPARNPVSQSAPASTPPSYASSTGISAVVPTTPITPPPLPWWKRFWGKPPTPLAPHGIPLAHTPTISSVIPATPPAQSPSPALISPAPTPLQRPIAAPASPAASPTMQSKVTAPVTPVHHNTSPVAHVRPQSPLSSMTKSRQISNLPKNFGSPSGLMTTPQSPTAGNLPRRLEDHIGNQYTHQGTVSTVEIESGNVWIRMGYIKLIVHESDVKHLGGLKFLRSLANRDITATGILISHPERSGLQILITKRSQIIT